MGTKVFSSSIFACIYITTLIGTILTSDECEQKTACLCEFDDDTDLDLSYLFPDKTFLNATNDKLTYYFHGCKNAAFTPPTNQTNNCSKPLTLCLFNATAQTYEAIGSEQTTKFNGDKNNLNLYEYSYKNENFTTVITLVCTPDFNENELVFHGATSKEHRLHLFSPKACKIEAHRGLGAGTKFFIIILVFASIYLIGGSCISYFLKGARGKEIIPNIDFWMSVPSLVKDGLYFILHGCSRRMVSTGDTYDQI